MEEQILVSVAEFELSDKIAGVPCYKTQAIENQIRTQLTSEGHALPWDNNDVRCKDPDKAFQDLP